MDRDTMKRVFIIRNNMANRKIYSNANDSFENKEKGKYFVSGKNKESLNRMAKKATEVLSFCLPIMRMIRQRYWIFLLGTMQK